MIRLLQGTVTAASVGMGCGSCCGSGVSAVLFTYLTTHAADARQSVRAFCTFYLGKIMAVVSLCLLSSYLGKAVLDETGRITGMNVDVNGLCDLVMIGIGTALIIRWFAEKKKSSCSICAHCGHTDHLNNEENEAGSISLFALWGMGAGYGISPCAPLILIAGYAATMPAAGAVVTGSVFALASAFVPMILLLLVSGILSPRLRKEIPGYLEIFRLLTYILLIIIFAADLFTSLL